MSVLDVLAGNLFYSKRGLFVLAVLAQAAPRRGVEGQPGFRAIPVNELVDGMPVATLCVGVGQAVQDRRSGVLQIGETQYHRRLLPTAPAADLACAEQPGEDASGRSSGSRKCHRSGDGAPRASVPVPTDLRPH